MPLPFCHPLLHPSPSYLITCCQWSSRSQLSGDWLHQGVGGTSSDASHTYQRSRTDPLSLSLPLPLPSLSTSHSASHTCSTAQTAAERRTSRIFLIVLEQKLKRHIRWGGGGRYPWRICWGVSDPQEAECVGECVFVPTCSCICASIMWIHCRSSSTADTRTRGSAHPSLPSPHSPPPHLLLLVPLGMSINMY